MADENDLVFNNMDEQDIEEDNDDDSELSESDDTDGNGDGDDEEEAVEVSDDDGSEGSSSAASVMPNLNRRRTPHLSNYNATPSTIINVVSNYMEEIDPESTHNMQGLQGPSDVQPTFMGDVWAGPKADAISIVGELAAQPLPPAQGFGDAASGIVGNEMPSPMASVPLIIEGSATEVASSVSMMSVDEQSPQESAMSIVTECSDSENAEFSSDSTSDSED